MVKGISKQVIVVQSPEEKLFEQAIFILKEDALKEGVTDEQLLREARRAAGEGKKASSKKLRLQGPVWACGGALATGLIWLITALW